MEVIETIAPISIEDLKKYFVNQDTKYIIDYKNSKLQGIKLLTYLSNLDVPCDLKIEENSDEFFNLIKDYLSCPFLVNVHTIEVAVIGILLAHKGLIKVPEYDKFIEENQNVLNEWQGILDSCTIYNMYMISHETFKEFVESYPVAEKTDTNGINFVSLLKHEDFYLYYNSIDQSKLKFYPNFFNDYIFKGKNLFAFWAVKENPMFVLTHGITSGLIKPGFSFNQEALV